MSVDRSLRMKSSLARHRNVLTRAERVALLIEREKFDPQRGALGLVKVGNRKVKASKKAKKEATAEEAATSAPAGTTPAAAPAAKPAAKPGK